ncbi:DNA polymerase IV [uncultured Eubacteriales bacterium]|uniref:DNA polymerase IV n=1 Tax=uncultured Eubacteriales bacterium TaxID=172733 RepID=A0A212JU45_9FIRM|nr:DNA polymerase IV [uncultured Eubacteriales bacterium]
MERTILHSDLNNFYASVECRDNPSLHGKPVAVCGDPAARHGIVLAKSQEAKKYGVSTGQAIWQAKQCCPDLVVVPPHYDRYLEVSAATRAIYESYTDQVEPFGLDECWLDVGGSLSLFGPGDAIADDIRARIKHELGLTVSVGVSFNKVFAKLGSDYRKPDATTVITKENYKDMVWALPVNNLLYVGPATEAKLGQYGVRTIGDLARSSVEFMSIVLGKNGAMLWRFANGLDSSGVSTYYTAPPIKSIGNSTTAPRDLATDDDVKITMFALCESVAARLREQNSACSTVSVGIRDTSLLWYVRQTKLYRPVCDSTSIFNAAFGLFQANRPVLAARSLSVSATGLSIAEESPQLSMFPEDNKALRRTDLEHAVDKMRRKYGYASIRRGIQLVHPELDLDAKRDHIVHPIGFLGTL